MNQEQENNNNKIRTMYRIDEMAIIVRKMYGYVLSLFSTSVPYYIYWFDLSCYEICETWYRSIGKLNSVVIIFYLVHPNAFSPWIEFTHRKRTYDTLLIQWDSASLLKYNEIPDILKRYLLQILSSYQITYITLSAIHLVFMSLATFSFYFILCVQQ